MKMRGMLLAASAITIIGTVTGGIIISGASQAQAQDAVTTGHKNSAIQARKTDELRRAREAQAALTGEEHADAPPPDFEDNEQDEDEDDILDLVNEHFMETYGSEAGPIAELEEKEKRIEAARRKASTYSMTRAQRDAMIAAEQNRQQAEAREQNATPAPANNKSGAGNTSRPWSSYGAGGGDNGQPPPRLFNNIER